MSSECFIIGDNELETIEYKTTPQQIKELLFDQPEDVQYEKFIDSFIERKFFTPLEYPHINTENLIKKGALWFINPSKFHILRPYYIMVSQALIDNPDKVEPMFYLRTIGGDIDLQKIYFSMNDYKEILDNAYNSKGFLFFIESIFYVPSSIFK